MSEQVSGIFKSSGKKGGFLRSLERSFRSTGNDPFVSIALAKNFKLVDGAHVEGTADGVGKLESIEKISGIDPEEWMKRKPFSDLIAISPCERFDLSQCDALPLRIVDLVAPIGKGTRQLIVSPPKAGKTTLLEQLAHGIHKVDPATRIIMLLVDERPAEVTHFRRSVPAEVLASSNDQSVAEHVELAELTLAHIRTELECGRDVVLLVDSLARRGRAFNMSGAGKGRMMSGGVEAGALDIPRRFFGLARNIEDGGSVTIVASTLIDTGSRMDQLIFEEFKGTGNSEIVLDRSMAEQRVFPAIDLAKSGTRKEDRLYSEGDMARLNKLRRVLSERKPKEAMESLLKLMDKHGTNRSFLDSIPA
ncbi:MAG: transcription termination factor Rho [Planctomycetes bacterium]|nr:transcription termination factor Rho [Planctomycetota bacterium]